MSATVKPPIRHLQWLIVILLCLGSLVNYLDRQTFSALANTLEKATTWFLASAPHTSNLAPVSCRKPKFAAEQNRPGWRWDFGFRDHWRTQRA
jgi:hypothetical protein